MDSGYLGGLGTEALLSPYSLGTHLKYLKYLLNYLFDNIKLKRKKYYIYILYYTAYYYILLNTNIDKPNLDPRWKTIIVKLIIYYCMGAATGHGQGRI